MPTRASGASSERTLQGNASGEQCLTCIACRVAGRAHQAVEADVGLAAPEPLGEDAALARVKVVPYVLRLPLRRKDGGTKRGFESERKMMSGRVTEG